MKLTKSDSLSPSPWQYKHDKPDWLKPQRGTSQNHKMGPALDMRKARFGGHHSCRCCCILWAYLGLFWPRHGTSHCSFETFETIHLRKTKTLWKWLNYHKPSRPGTRTPVGQSKSWRQNAGGPPNFKAFLRMPNGGGFVDFRKSPNLRYKIPVLQMRGCLPKKKTLLLP